MAEVTAVAHINSDSSLRSTGGFNYDDNHVGRLNVALYSAYHILVIVIGQIQMTFMKKSILEYVDGSS
ncbi:MAG: hypothetical protein SVY15_07645 [Halobacteriota archaeon]|nr:hypothetical protein [Halobacteriota archaeon]